MAAIRDSSASTTTVPADTPESTRERLLRRRLSPRWRCVAAGGDVASRSANWDGDLPRRWLFARSVAGRVTRPGLATPFALEVSTTDGSDLPEVVTLRMDTSYLSIFDFNGLEPTPSTSFSTNDWTWWSFDVPPDQSSLRVGLDARLEPSVQWARSGSAALEIDGVSLVSVDFTTWVMP